MLLREKQNEILFAAPIITVVLAISPTSAATVACTSEAMAKLPPPSMPCRTVHANGRWWGRNRHYEAALVIRAIDEETAHAAGAHLFKADLLLAGEGWHSEIKASHQVGSQTGSCPNSLHEPWHGSCRLIPAGGFQGPAVNTQRRRAIILRSRGVVL